MLADAFSEFISASSLLEASYRDLQQEVAHLGLELAERNAALSRSLAENDRMRAALQQMIDSMPCGVLVLDTAETIVMINPEGRRLLELGSAHVRSLRELSAISQVNFESLMEGPPKADSTTRCASPPRRESAGWPSATASSACTRPIWKPEASGRAAEHLDSPRHHRQQAG
jgi:PAS domain-containing protein